jgi:hypothetical protein
MALIGHIGWRAIDRLLRVSLGWDGLAQHTLGPILTGKGKSKHKCVETMWIMISEPIAKTVRRRHLRTPPHLPPDIGRAEL